MYAYSAYKLECLALCYCVREWDDYLHGVKFTVETDHRALMLMLDNSNRIVANWLQIVLDYRFDVIHIPGVTNIAPDHLSRPHGACRLYAACYVHSRRPITTSGTLHSVDRPRQ